MPKALIAAKAPPGPNGIFFDYSRYRKIMASGSYTEAMNSIGEYVNFIESDRQEQLESEAEQFGKQAE